MSPTNRQDARSAAAQRGIGAPSALDLRKQRVRRTVLALVLVVGAVAIGALGYYWMSRPEVYRPGEDMAEITTALARNLPRGAPEIRFEDVTIAAGLGEYRAFAGPRSSQLPEDMGPGAAWGDYDNDGDDDLFVVSNGAALNAPVEDRAPCLLFENLGDGTFRPVESFPETRIIGLGCAWGDHNGDGWIDLVVTGYGDLLLFRNESGMLVRDTAIGDHRGFWAGASWGDYDNDRDLDLYVCGYVQYVQDESAAGRESRQYGAVIPYTLNPSSYSPQPNLLVRNDGGAFTEVAESLGVANPEGRSLGAVWHDFDQDGWLDLYIANDISDNAFYRNVGGAFTDISHAAWVADYRGAMGLAVGDYDRDGDDDLFVSHWTAQENALYASMLVDFRNVRRPPSAGSSEGEARPSVQFVDQADLAGLGQIALQRIGWGAEFADFDADGWLDLAVANGSTFETDDVPPLLKPQTSFLFWNRQGEYFHDLAPGCPALAVPRVTRGLAVSDYDLDSDLDVLLVHRDAGLQLLRNDMQTGHWLQLRLRGRDASGALTGRGEGATATVHLGETRLRRSVTSVSYLSQSSSVLHIGLGESAQADLVEVSWPGGGVDRYENIVVDRVWELREGDSVPRARTAGPQDEVDRSPFDGLTERQRIALFWEKQRAGVRAMKVDRELDQAIGLFRQALFLDPKHEDARFFLATCLASRGELNEAIGELRTLIDINPRSHRALKQLGLLTVETARSRDDLRAALALLDRALQLNLEETGVLLAMGETHLLLGELDSAGQCLSHATQTNHQADGGFFLLGYIAWKRGDAEQARTMLRRTAEARGPDWKPKGATAEGDVSARQHVDLLPLTRFHNAWDGPSEPEAAFGELDEYLESLEQFRGLHNQ